MTISKEQFDEIFKKVDDDYGTTATLVQKLEYTKNRIKNTIGEEIDLKDYVDLENARKESDEQEKTILRERMEGRWKAEREKEEKRIREWNASMDASVKKFRDARAMEMKEGTGGQIDVRKQALKMQARIIKERKQALLDELKAIEEQSRAVQKELGRIEPPAWWTLGDEILDLINDDPWLKARDPGSDDFARVEWVVTGHVSEFYIVVYKSNEKYLVGYEMEYNFEFKHMEDEIDEEVNHVIPTQLFGELFKRDGIKWEDVKGYGDRHDLEALYYFKREYFDYLYFVECNSLESVKDVVLKALLATKEMDRDISFSFAM